MNKLSRQDMARVAALEIAEGCCVNLGIGVPTLIADYVPADREILLQSEQGLLGLGPKAESGQEDEDIVNAGKHHVTLATLQNPWAAVFLAVLHQDPDVRCTGSEIHRTAHSRQLI